MKWSLKLQILWITLDDEWKVKRLFMRMAEVQREKARVIKYTLFWAFNRNRELETKYKVARTMNPKLRTQVRLQRRDLVLLVKEKEEKKWTEVNVDYFGRHLDFNFNNMEMSPGNPEWRPKGSSSSSS